MSKELKCPKCGSVFTVDEADYAGILSQVKNAEFSQEVERRIGELHAQWQAQQQVASTQQATGFQQQLMQKDRALMEKEAELATLRAQANNAVLSERQKQSDALHQKEAEIIRLQASVREKENEAKLREGNLKEHYENRLKLAEEQVAYYKDLKTRMSTKMVGETLEIHCSTEFNRVRPLFPNAYFEKDNDASGGSKGDFIFRDFVDDFEYVSVMFEMKNEMDETATKHKNEDFFKKLDADRRAKKCEYAVLVSLLEPESELYNTGIVDVSHKYEKMYVIRPQFFIPLITLLVQTSRKTVDYQRQLEVAKNQSVDVTNFENRLQDMKEGFFRNVDLAHRQYEEAIAAIDKSIEQLQKIKEKLTSSGNNLRLANNKLQDITIKKLTRGNKTMEDMFSAES
nr:DUF2130 domain-containing protein [Paludibacteraceae bacterium]